MAKNQIRRTLPPVGSVFQHRYKGQIMEMEVIKTKDGVRFRVGDEVFRSPTAAAKFIVGRDHPVNGWAFWNMKR